MHRKRVLTALILVPVLVAGLLWGGSLFFDLLIILITILCLYEYFEMALRDDSPIFKISGIFLGLIPLFFTIFKKEEVYLLFGLFLLFALSIIICVMTYRAQKFPFLFLAITAFGAGYISLCSSLIYLIYQFPNGLGWISFLFVVVFLADTGAYYAGNLMGRHKLCPAISKGKTVEGSIGGILASVFGALFCWISFFNFFDLRLLVPLSILLAIVSQIGDLAESIIKRHFGIKDSGTILPGHGGVFDRVDALLYAGPTLYWVLFFSNGNFYLR